MMIMKKIKDLLSPKSIKERNISPIFAAGVVWMILGFAYCIWYYIVYGKMGIFSDLSAEMVMADLLNKEHRIVTDSWYYPTEVHVFQHAFLLQIGLLFFPHNWPAARVFATIICLVLFGAGYFYLAKGIGMKEYAPWGAGFLFWPFSPLWLNWTLEYGYNLIFPLFTVGIITNYRSELGRVKKIIMIAAGCILGLVSGLNGPKLLFNFYIPCVGAFLLCLVISAGESDADNLKSYIKKNTQDIMRALLSIIFIVSDLVGYLINSRVLSAKYVFVNYAEDTVWLEERYHSFDELLDSFLRVFGYIPGEQVVSFEGIASLLGLLLGVIVVMCIIWCAASMRKVGKEERPLVLICFIGFVFCFIVFCYIKGYCDWYWILQYPFFITAFLILVKNTNKKVAAVNLLVLIVFGISVSIMSVNTVRWRVDYDSGLGTYDQVEAAEYLESENIKYGISMAWSAQKIEELTSGNVEMYVVDSYKYAFLPSIWLQKKSHLTPPPSDEKCAVVIANLECYSNPWELDVVKYGDYEYEKMFGTIHVYVYDSYDRIAEAFERANAER